MDDEKYRAHHLDTIICYHDYLDHAWNAFRHLEVKNYAAQSRFHHRPAWTTRPRFDEFQYLEAKFYGAHHQDFVIGHPEHLEHFFYPYIHTSCSSHKKEEEKKEVGKIRAHMTSRSTRKRQLWSYKRRKNRRPLDVGKCTNKQKRVGFTQSFVWNVNFTQIFG